MTRLDRTMVFLCIICQVFNVAMFIILPETIQINLLSNSASGITITAIYYCALVGIVEVLLTFFIVHSKKTVWNKIWLGILFLVIIGKIYVGVINFMEIVL